MVTFLAVAVMSVFAAAGLLHLYWAVGGKLAKSAAVPEVSGQAAFTPSRGATATVAVALFAAGFVVGAASGLVRVPISVSTLTFLMYAMALVFLARAVGEFRLVGFFKRVRGTTFARFDTLLYSPLCLLIGLAILFIATSSP